MAEWSLDLITDRTQADVDRVLYLHGLKWRNMSTDERAEWLGYLKGCYNYYDLNRVESAVDYLASVFREYGYMSDVDVKLDWTREDEEFDFDRYLGNVQTLIDVIGVPQLADDLPYDMELLTYEEANAIEQILVNIHTYIGWMADSFRYSNQYYSGQTFYDLAGWDA